MRFKLALLFFFFLFPFSNPAFAYSTPNVPVDDPVYRDIDKLIAAGLVKDVIYGQRPWSRLEIARIISVAGKNREKLGPPVAPDDREVSLRLYLDDILKRLQERFHEEPKGLRLHPLEEVRFDYTILDSPFRTVPVSNGLGLIDAVINPLVAYREGRHYVDGHTIGLETAHSAKLSKYFSLYFRPRFEILAPNTGSSEVNFLVQQLYGKFAYKNFELGIGRDSLIWGQGENGGFLLSNNARPLDMITLGNVSPFYLPWIFKYLGPNSLRFFFAEMGPEREFPHAILSGYKWSIKPVGFLELGLNHVVMMGGDGANGPSFLEAIGEFTGILSVLTENKRGGAAFTNRLLSLEGRMTIPPLRNSVLYAELAFDDTNSEIDILFEDNAMYYAGIYVPRLAHDGSIDLRVEYKHIPGVSYRHGRYTSGFTLNKRILGDESGPDSDVMSVKLRADLAEDFLLSSEIDYERRDSDTFSTITSGPDIIDIFKFQDNPAEHRWRLQTGLLWQAGKNLKAEIQVGYEHATNFNFIQNADVDNFLGSFSLTWRPASNLLNP